MMASPYPSMKVKRFRRLLGRAFGYERVKGRGKGSHTILRSNRGYPDLVDGFHDGVEIPPHRVKRILIDDVGLTNQQALEVVREHG